MRPYRGYTKEGKWVYGYYLKIRGTHCIVTKDAYIGIVSADVEGGWYEVIPETVGQFTGLKDKNGKENFHKDILDWDGNRFVIDWDNASGQWYGQPMAGNKERGILSGCAFCKTLNIGNIHTSPELMEAK